MAKLKLHAKDLRNIGYEQGSLISHAIGLAEKHHKHSTKEDVLSILKQLLVNPDAFVEDETFGKVAQRMLETVEKDQTIALNETPVETVIFGKNIIEKEALIQMNTSARVPVAVAAALMPDAHSGYGLPIGGVLATDNAVIPYGVGVDIACRMCLSIFNISDIELQRRNHELKKILMENTLFGAGMSFKNPSDHEVLEHPLFKEDKFIRSMKDKAWKQLGSSGSGNHFVEFGVVEIGTLDATLNVPVGKYLALLSHSGSRGLGATIAQTYTKIAMEKRQLQKEGKHLAWLTLDEEEGQNYWNAMNLAGDYASANHAIIHKKIAKTLNEKPLRIVENHHNFAWKEIHNGKEVIVHRKGATPAAKDELGVIPGSMTANGYIVKGRGNAASLNSASHGAGRQLSRTAAKNTITNAAFKTYLKEQGVTLIGGGLDEAPMAYKDINEVMQSQQDLVDIVGVFKPKIVKMDEN